MPQLDRLAYVSEVSWLIFSFLFLYIVILKNSLHKLYKVLKYRRNILTSSKEVIVKYEQELYLSKVSTKNMIINFYSELKELSDKVSKLVDIRMDERKKVIKDELDVSRLELKDMILKNKVLKEKRLNVKNLLEESNMIKDKSILKKKVEIN